MSREGLQAEVEDLRRKIEELESENASLRKLRFGGLQGPLANSWAAEEAFSSPSTPERRETGEDYFAVVQTASEAICIVQDGLFKFVNPAGTQLTGYSEGELLFKPFSELTHPEDLEDVTKIYMMRIRGENVSPGHRFRIIAKGGDVRWVQSWSASISRQGQPAVLSMIRDVTGEVQEEERLLAVRAELDRRVQERTVELQQMNKKLEAEIAQRALAEDALRFTQFAVDNSAEAAFWIRSDGSHIYVNDAACRSLGYSREELLSLSLQDIDPDYPIDKWDEHWQETKQRGSSIIETRHRRKDGRLFPVEVRINYVEFEGQEYHCSFAVDITERKKSEQTLLESMQKFQSIVENSLAGIFTIDHAYRFVYVNDELCRILGYSRKNLLGKDFREVLPDEYRPVVVDRYLRRQRGGEGPSRYDLEVVRGDGRIRRVEMLVRVVRDASGSPRSMGQLIDITERKQAEEALRKSEQNYRELVQNANSIILRLNRKGEVTFLNEYGQNFFGYPEEDIVGRHVIGTIVPETESGGRDLRPLMEQICSNPRAFEHNINENMLRDGSRVWVEWTNKAVFDEQSQLVEIFSVGTDITERRRTENAIGKIVAGVSSEIGSRFFGSIASHFASTLGADCTLIGELIDRQEGEQIRTLALCLDGQVSDNITYPLEGSPCEIALRKGLWSSSRSVRKDFPHDTKLAKLDAEGYVGVKLSDSSGLPLGVMAALYRSPITDVQFAESVLQIFAARTAAEIDRKRVEEDRLRLVSAIEQAGESILITDPSGKILYANPSFTETTGYSLEEALGQTPALLGNGTHAESFYLDLWSRIKRGEIWRGRFTNKKKDGTLYEETASIAPIRDETGEILNFVMVGRDVTSETMLEKQLNQAQKMEAIGTLAGGIAHDFNNLLQAILGYSDLLIMKKSRGDPERKKLEVIRNAARDGADLVSRILTFSRKAESRTRPVDLNEVIRRALRLLRRTVPRMIDIQLKLARNLQIIDADPAQVEQVLLNLAINAHHAMPDGGKLLIETCNVVLKDEYLLTHLGARAGHYVLLTVSDTGAGMEPDVLDRIFEPFFTTKTNGEGTGLGLSMIHGIVSQHGGYIRCYSEPARGTSFKIYLPVSDSERYSDVTITREMPAFGTETILLVDDDDRIRELGAQMIEMGGYRVVKARSGEEALEIYIAQKADVSLVILDLIMPGMGGNRCLEELLRVDPEVRVLVASGYSPNGLTQAEKGRGARGFINKPYDAKDLLIAVRNILDRGHL